MMILPNLCSKIAVLISDAQNNVRQTAVETLVSLFQIFGNSIITELQENNVLKPPQLRILQDAIASSTSKTSSGIGNQTRIIHIDGLDLDDNDDDDNNDDDFDFNDMNKNSTKGDNSTFNTSQSESTKYSGLNSTRNQSVRPFSAKEIGTGGSGFGSQSPSNLSHLTRKSSFTKLETVTVSETVPNPSSLTQETSVYHPVTFINLLGEGTPPKLSSIYCEKDLQKVMNTITTGLSNTDDWQARISALSLLQGLVVGDGLEFSSFIPMLRSCQDLVGGRVTRMLKQYICDQLCSAIIV